MKGKKWSGKGKGAVTRFILSLLSSLLFVLAIPCEIFPYGNPIIGVFALAPFFAAVGSAGSRREAAFLGALFGLVNTVLTYFWLLFFLNFSVWTISGVTIAHVYFFIILAVFLERFSQMNHIYRPFLVSAVWIVYEYIKSIGFLGFPYGLAAYPVNMVLPLIQTADILGIWGIGYLVVLVNALLGEMIMGALPSRSRCPGCADTLPRAGQPQLASQWAAALLLVTASLVYGFSALSRDIPVVKHAVIAVVQQNTDSWTSGNDMNGLLVSQRLTREAIAERNGDVDLVAWSENTFRRPYIDAQRQFNRNPKEDPFIPFLREIGKPVLAGSPVFRNRELREAYNAVILIDKTGKPVEFYAKQHPVPIAERIPFRNGLVEKFFTTVVGLETSGWTPGEGFTVFTIPIARRSGSGNDGEQGNAPDGEPGRESTQTLTFGTPICFEDSFAYICSGFFREGAEILINLTNDSWSKTVSAQTQHFVTARFRSVEHRRVLVRSSNSGVSTVVDPWGRMLVTLPFFTECSAGVDVPVYDAGKPTPYSLYGDTLPYILAVLLLIVLIKSNRDKKTSRIRSGSGRLNDR